MKNKKDDKKKRLMALGLSTSPILLYLKYISIATMVFLVIIAPASADVTYEDIWQLLDDSTVTLQKENWTVNIGANDTTNYRLEVNGTGYFKDDLRIDEKLLCKGTNIIIGDDCDATGYDSIVIGYQNLDEFFENLILGRNNFIYDDYSTERATVIGNTNLVGAFDNGGQSVVIGSTNIVDGTFNSVFGSSNTVLGETNQVFGHNNMADCNNTIIIGSGITTYNDSDIIIGESTKMVKSASVGEGLVVDDGITVYGENDELSTISIHAPDESTWNMLMYNDFWDSINPSFGAWIDNSDGDFAMGTESKTDFKIFTDGYANERMIISDEGHVNFTIDGDTEYISIIPDDSNMSYYHYHNAGMTHRSPLAYFYAGHSSEETWGKIYAQRSVLDGSDKFIIKSNKAIDIRAGDGNEIISLEGIVVFKNGFPLGFGGSGSFLPYHNFESFTDGNTVNVLTLDRNNGGGFVTDYEFIFNSENNDDYDFYLNTSKGNALSLDAETGDLNITTNVTIDSDKSFTWSSYLSMTTEIDSKSSIKINPFDEDNYVIPLVPTNNTDMTGFTYTISNGRFTFNNSGVYQITFNPIMMGSTLDEYKTILYKDGVEFYNHEYFIHSSVGPTERSITLIKDFNAGEYLTVEVASSDAVDTVSLRDGTTLSINRIA